MQISTRTADLHGIFTNFEPKTMQSRTPAADLHGFSLGVVKVYD